MYEVYEKATKKREIGANLAMDGSSSFDGLLDFNSVSINQRRNEPLVCDFSWTKIGSNYCTFLYKAFHVEKHLFGRETRSVNKNNSLRSSKCWFCTVSSLAYVRFIKLSNNKSGFCFCLVVGRHQIIKSSMWTTLQIS